MQELENTRRLILAKDDNKFHLPVGNLLDLHVDVTLGKLGLDNWSCHGSWAGAGLGSCELGTFASWRMLENASRSGCWNIHGGEFVL